MWQPRWEGSLGKNGYMYMYSWVPSLLTWNYHNIFNRLYTNTKKSLKNRLYTNTKKSLKKLKSIFRKTSFCDFCLSLLENVEWETYEGVTHTTWPSTPWGSSWVGKTLLRELSSQMVKKTICQWHLKAHSAWFFLAVESSPLLDVGKKHLLPLGANLNMPLSLKPEYTLVLSWTGVH